MNSSIKEAVVIIDIENEDCLFDCAEKICKFFKNDIDVDEVKSAIIKRENLGDTYIGNHQIIIHISDKKINNDFIVYSKLKKMIYWKSRNSQKKYFIDKIIFLGINEDRVGKYEPKYLLKFYDNPGIVDDLTKKLRVFEFKALK